MRPRTRVTGRVTRRLVHLAIVIAVAAAAILVPASPAAAAELVTEFPARSVTAGSTVTFDVQVVSAVRERVSLEIIEEPADWDVQLLGGGANVSAVITDPENPVSVSVRVAVPFDAPTGPNRVLLRGTSGQGSSQLALDLDVTDLAGDAFELSTQFSSLRGPAEGTFTFTVDLRNNTTTEEEFNILAQGPPGWVVSAAPAGQEQATTISVAPGSTSQIQVSADPPNDAPANRYPINLQLSGPASANVDLVAEIEGVGELVFETIDQRLNAKGNPGKTTTIDMVVANSGDAPIEGILLLVNSFPEGWDIDFTPEQITTLAPGEVQTVTVDVRPSGDAVAGDYELNVTASPQGDPEIRTIRFTVESSTIFGWVGIIIIVIAVGALLFIFRRYGRR